METPYESDLVMSAKPHKKGPRAMLISHKLKCIFIHIQKTAGSSIDHVLKEADNNSLLGLSGVSYRHGHAIDIRKSLEKEIWDSYFKFAFVRNPWDRLVAWYELIQKWLKNNDPKFRELVVVNQVCQKSVCFDDFIRNCFENVREKQGERAGFGYNQLDYLTDENGELIVDFIGRFEALNKDCQKVCERLDLSMTSLPHINFNAHKHYSCYYSKETRAMVGDRYKRDIEYFGYRFEKRRFRLLENPRTWPLRPMVKKMIKKIKQYQK
jgi:chondroitin 4-sulfotransferase 11